MKEKEIKKEYWEKKQKKILELLQKEGNLSPKTFKVHSYEEGYWDGLKFAAFLINEMKP